MHGGMHDLLEHVSLTIVFYHIPQVIIRIEDFHPQTLRVGVISHHALHHITASGVLRGQEISLVIEWDFGQKYVVEEGLLVMPRVVVTEADQVVRRALVHVVPAGVLTDEILLPGCNLLLADLI